MSADNNLPARPPAATGTHAIAYRTIDPLRGFPERTVPVPVGRAAIAGLVEQGYLVLPGFLGAEPLAAMRRALDEVLTAEAGPRWRETAPPAGFFPGISWTGTPASSRCCATPC